MLIVNAGNKKAEEEAFLEQQQQLQEQHPELQDSLCLKLTGKYTNQDRTIRKAVLQ